MGSARSDKNILGHKVDTEANWKFKLCRFDNLIRHVSYQTKKRLASLIITMKKKKGEKTRSIQLIHQC